jgi:putative oxidoreductase
MARSARNLLFGTHTTGPVGDLGLLFLRLFAGLALAFAHGINKLPPSERFVGRVAGFGFPAPEVFAWLSGFAEFGCGILVAIGLLTRPAATIIVGNMVVVVLFAHAGDPFGRRELPLLFGFVFLMFVLVGAGRYSVDALIRGRR